MTVVLDPDSPEPPYEQVRRQIASGAADGTLAPGHRLPTVRGLADDLGLAANTVAKAYRALEADGIVETHGRRGTMIATRRGDDLETREAAAAFAALARRQGLSKDEALALVDQHWT
ncbi:MAG: GntR family transcriptional regulator [Aeromicrobium sp.]|nr:GntR family transcriptional regulator [Aeromicrobium sp.]